ncbi:hypothetical protein OA542_00070 [Opitutae bacterium]|nr:hypothetical protein [Opitutae bacterium]
MSTQIESFNNKSQSTMDYNFQDIEGERFICINALETIPTFFVSMISAQDHWFFTATNGALSAGRGSPGNSLFPYYTVDKIINNSNCTGPQTIIKVANRVWEPFNPSSERIFSISRKIYKSINGDTLIFEEINQDLELKFSFTWSTSEKYGFIRRSRLVNLSTDDTEITLIDGLSDFLASGVDDRTHLAYSCLTDAYKVSELELSNQLLVHRMVASLVDEAIPLECLKATVLWSYGWDDASVLIQQSDVEQFLNDPSFQGSNFSRGLRGCYYNSGSFQIRSNGVKSWSIVADIDKTQSEVAELYIALKDKDALWQSVIEDITEGKNALEELIQASDGLQICSEEIVSTHHRANVLFNIMRGGVFRDNYSISKNLLQSHLSNHNSKLAKSDLAIVEELSEEFTYNDLVVASAKGSLDLQRISNEYLPLVFSRRHGDPSRPWNRFNIKTKDENGNSIVGFQGNWRDIFQNWEALAWSFPYYNVAFIHKFLNATTADGYNPYRITDNGIEWEEPDPNDPWASIGYWGDHQIIYLVKLLEFTESLKPKSLKSLLNNDLFVYADVPYEIKDFSFLKENPNHSIYFNDIRNETIFKRVSLTGADGKLIHGENGLIVRANLFEKLLIPLLVKLSNYIPNGGIWMNTQRPEWNDANNALAGFGISMVTTYYIKRYLDFFDSLLEKNQELKCFASLKSFIQDIHEVFAEDPKAVNKDNHIRYQIVEKLGKAGERYRKNIYEGIFGAKEEIKVSKLKIFIQNVQKHLQEAIRANLRSDGLYNAYNVLHMNPNDKLASIECLGPMLEGQVAVLSSKALSAKEAKALLKSLRNSDLYCEKRKSYILYSDKRLPAFLDYNKVDTQSAKSISALALMIQQKDKRIIESSPDNCFRFNSSIRNCFELKEVIDKLAKDAFLSSYILKDEKAILELYEATFNHKAFTGRSGSMFAYEGLGSIYWHMVSKLMLSVQEIALEQEYDEDFKELVASYYHVQEGLGFRKKASEYGAFTADAYSHTPSFAGAQQPGLTGMVKEGVICRFGELGVQLNNETIKFKPRLLRSKELLKQSKDTVCIYPDKTKRTIKIPKYSLLFTITQIPVIYKCSDSEVAEIRVEFLDGNAETITGDILPQFIAKTLLNRTSNIFAIYVSQPSSRFIS